jgi:tryptophanase
MTKSKKSPTIFEPFKIKMVEPLPILGTDERRTRIREADFNLFRLPAKYVTFDFLTDSGTSAMSTEQWAGMIRADESYAGSTSFEHFEKAVQDLTGMPFVIPTHQGRAAEALLMRAFVKPGQVVIGNTHFDTTRANIQDAGAEALDLPDPDSAISDKMANFKGNIDLDRLAATLAERSSKCAALIMTLTNNSVGGQPVSMSNLRAAKELVRKYDIPLFIDAARFAENAYFVKLREPGYAQKSVSAIVSEAFSLADGVLMSSKKDAFGNIGGFLALHDSNLAQEVRSLMVITEGFPTYGGLAGRDLEALAIGLKEVLDESYLAYRIRSTEYLGNGLMDAGFKMVVPFGGHAAYIDAGASLPHVPAHQFPGQALSVALYQELGLRSVEVGTVMLGSRDPKTGEEKLAPKELVRLAIPRRVYTQSHIDYIIEMAHEMHGRLRDLGGFEFTYQAPVLRHFTAKFRPL